MTGGQGNFLWERVLYNLQLFPPYPLKTGGGGGAAQEQFITRMGPNGVNALVNFFRGQTW